MKDIILTGYWGSQIKSVKLSFPHGAGQVVHIIVDGYLQGEFVKRSGEWAFWLNKGSDLCSNDIEVLKELIEKSQ